MIVSTWRFLVAIATRMGEGHVGLVAAGIAFYAIFAIFPGMAATIAIWSLVADPAVMQSYLHVAAEFIPPEPWAILNDQIGTLLSGPKASLGWTTGLSVAVALYSARAGVSALVQGLNVIRGTPQRSGLWSYVFDYTLTLALVAVMLVALTLAVVVPIVVNFLHLGQIGSWTVAALPLVGSFVLILTALGMLYRFGPTGGSRDGWLTPGSALAALAWSAVSLGFTYYLTNFGAYNRIYGSIGAVVALLMWLYLSSYVVLLGAIVNIEVERLRELRRA
jgi:membrane protein